MLARINHELNGNFDLGCFELRSLDNRVLNRIDRIDPILDGKHLGVDIRAISGVVGTGLFLGMADTVLIGKGHDLQLVEERRRGKQVQ